MLVKVTAVQCEWVGHVFIQYKKPYQQGKQRYSVIAVSESDDREQFEEAKQVKVGDWIDVDESPTETFEPEELLTFTSTTPLAKRTTWKRILRDRRK